MVWSTLEPRVPANEMIDMLTDRKAPNREDRMKLTERRRRRRRRTGGAAEIPERREASRAEAAPDEEAHSTAK